MRQGFRWPGRPPFDRPSGRSPFDRPSSRSPFAVKIAGAARRIACATLLLGAAAAALAAPEQKQLSIVKPALRQSEEGPPLSASFSFVTGETVFLSFQIRGFKVSDESKIELRARIEVVDPQGTAVAPASEQTISTEVSPEDKDWMPVVRTSFELPPLALAGIYQARLSAEDKLSGQKADSTLNITVRGRKVEPSDKLTVRDFRFLRNEEDREALTPAVYRPGDAIWGQFEIVGFKYGEKNHIHVEYGIAVLAPSGKSLYSQPTAAVEDDATFYPKRYLPGQLSLTLGKDFRAGEYTVVLTLRDEVGGQTEEEKFPFKVE